MALAGMEMMEVTDVEEPARAKPDRCETFGNSRGAKHAPQLHEALLSSQLYLTINLPLQQL